MHLVILAFLIENCALRDSDECLQNSPGWDTRFKCSTSTQYCTTYAKDLRRCCPISCETGPFNEDDCNNFDASGTCIYPNDAQCSLTGLSI